MTEFKAKINVVRGGVAHAAGTTFSADEHDLADALARGWVERVAEPVRPVQTPKPVAVAKPRPRP